MAKNQKPAAEPAPPVPPVAEQDQPVVEAPVDVVTPESPPEPPAAQSSSTTVKVRVLRDGSYGKCNDVVTMDAELAASLAGEVDADPAAVEYAESLAQ
jgi:hypothetical protein